jgi:hypothetical protein
MKRVTLLLCLLVCVFASYAQNGTKKQKKGKADSGLVIGNGKTLSQVMAANKLDEATVETLVLKGELSTNDWKLLKTMATNNALKNIDLSAVTNTTLPNQAFKDCAKLEALVFPQHGKLKEIPVEVCRNCKALKEIKIPEGVDAVINHAFAVCSSMTKIYLPSTITYLYGYCFEQCPITEIHLKSKPVQVYRVWRAPSQVGDPRAYSFVFSGSLPRTATLYVPFEYIDLYQKPLPEDCVSKHLQKELAKNEWSETCQRNLFSWANAQTIIEAEK